VATREVRVRVRVEVRVEVRVGKAQ